MIYLHLEESISPQGDWPVEPSILEEAAQATIHYTNPDLQADVTLVLSDDAQLQQLNREYLSIDAPTDVLSFSGGDIDPDTQLTYLGDVVLSYPRAVLQAAASGHTVEAELQLLVVHGTLHLLGYDHADEIEKNQMWQAQAAVLSNLGCPITGPAGE